MRAKGLSKKEVLAKLQQAHDKDGKYRDGKILCSMCTAPHPTAKKAHSMFLESNLGDSGLFPGSVLLEEEAISALAKLLHGPKGATGFIVSGGTEANLMAMYAARNASKIETPEVILPESAHFSFKKICDMLNLKLVKASLDSTGRVDPASVEQQINKRTVAIVGNAGSAELGTIDPIETLSKIAIKHNLQLHVDAAFGGLVIPFLKELGYLVPSFDFQLEGVRSVTIDPHKMGMSTIPAGGILFRNNKSTECIKTETPYLNDDYQHTFVGTRSAASTAGTWAVLNLLGREGFKKTVAHCMNLTTFLYEGLEAAGFEVLLRPTMNIVAFRNANPKLLVEKLRQHGWYISFVPRLGCMRVVIMPHTTKQHVIEFLQLLNELNKEYRSNPSPLNPEHASFIGKSFKAT